jgi:hypothetical protein
MRLPFPPTLKIKLKHVIADLIRNPTEECTFSFHYNGAGIAAFAAITAGCIPAVPTGLWEELTFIQLKKAVCESLHTA